MYVTATNSDITSIQFLPSQCWSKCRSFFYYNITVRVYFLGQKNLSTINTAIRYSSGTRDIFYAEARRENPI